MAAEWRRRRERRCHFEEKMSLEEAHHYRGPWIKTWRKKEMNEGRGIRKRKVVNSNFLNNIGFIKIKKNL